jgi:hypothetical protein
MLVADGTSCVASAGGGGHTYIRGPQPLLVALRGGAIY